MPHLHLETPRKNPCLIHPDLGVHYLPARAGSGVGDVKLGTVAGNVYGAAIFTEAGAPILTVVGKVKPVENCPVIPGISGKMEQSIK